jgi:hypothetical protein
VHEVRTATAEPRGATAFSIWPLAHWATAPAKNAALQQTGYCAGDVAGECRDRAPGDRVVVIGRWVGKGKGSGIEVQQPVTHVFTLHDGRAVRVELGYTGRDEALEAAGLSE